MRLKVILVVVLAAATPASGHDRVTTKLTWSREIARIVYARCLTCHREGGRSFSLSTYAEARPWAVAIKDEVLTRRMPPWNAVKGFGRFKNDLGLTQEELSLIADWVEGGAPEGDPMLMPVRPAAVAAAKFPPAREIAFSAYWEKLGLPPFSMEHVSPRADSRYRDEPLSRAFDVGYQRHTQFRYEWISPPPSPANIYADFLNRHHREGIQHIGMPVDDLPRSVAGYEKLGYHVRQAGAQHAYLDTDSVGGISVELVQRH